MKSSGKMGKSPEFHVFLRAKWNNPAVHYMDSSQVWSIPFESQSSHPSLWHFQSSKKKTATQNN
jgi:hypothetical protein